MADTWATRIEGTVTRSDGSVVSFSIHPDCGWQQWGAYKEILSANVDVMDAMVAGLTDAGVEPRDEPDETDTEADSDGEDGPAVTTWSPDPCCEWCGYSRTETETEQCPAAPPSSDGTHAFDYEEGN